MNNKTALVIVGLTVASCLVTEKSDEISGVYVREHSFEVLHVESGAKVGIRSIRDSIFIEAVPDGYRVSNRKWRKNDYDLDGWRSMEHAEDRPMPAFLASFDSNTLFDGDHKVVLYFDPKQKRIYREKQGAVFYTRVN
jgi:hypothetical protein